MVIAVVLFFRKGLKGFFSLRYVTILFFIIKLLNMFSSGRRLQSRGLLIDNQSWKLDFLFCCWISSTFQCITMEIKYISLPYLMPIFYHQERIVRFLFYVRGWEVVLLIFHIKCLFRKLIALLFAVNK